MFSEVPNALTFILVQKGKQEILALSFKVSKASDEVHTNTAPNGE